MTNRTVADLTNVTKFLRESVVEVNGFSSVSYSILLNEENLKEPIRGEIKNSKVVRGFKLSIRCDSHIGITYDIHRGAQLAPLLWVLNKFVLNCRAINYITKLPFGFAYLCMYDN